MLEKKNTWSHRYFKHLSLLNVIDLKKNLGEKTT